MRRWLAALMVLPACAGGGQAQTTASSTSAPQSVVADTAPSTVADVADPPATQSAASSPSAVSAPPTASTTVVDSDLVVPTGFDLVGARVTAADGATCDLCLWLADSGELRRQGLMSVTDLGPADGMAFVYAGPTTTRFWMKDTLLPLSIAFFGIDGAFIDSFDMDPCPAQDSADCLRYPTPRAFVVAVETNQGGLAALDMLSGSTLELLDFPCQLGVVPGSSG